MSDPAAARSTVDVSGVVPEARHIVQRVAEIYLRHLDASFIGMEALGSAVTGDFIPGCSDVDIHMYADDAAFVEPWRLPFEMTVAIHRELSAIDVAPFGYVQCYVLPARLLEGWNGPIPGAWHLVAGRAPLAEATAGELRDAAHRSLAELRPVPRFLENALLDYGDVRLPRLARLICTNDVWPHLRHLRIARGMDPIAAWNQPKLAAVESLPADSPAGQAARAFVEALHAYYPERTSTDAALALLERGVAFLHAVKEEYARLTET
ncbi:MAG: hypothetical protein WEC75_01745 [Dehalococcoidia bacterium]